MQPRDSLTPLALSLMTIFDAFGTIGCTLRLVHARTGLFGLLLGGLVLAAQEGRGAARDPGALAPDPKQPSTRLIPGDGCEAIDSPPIGWGATPYLPLEGGRARSARG